MSEPIYVAKSKKRGKGLFAKRRIKKGELIFKFKGEKISSKNLYRVSQGGRDIVVDPLQIASNFYLDLKKPYVYVNHSCDPNAGIKNSCDLVAIKSIPKSTEITFDYSSTWFDGFKCNCGSKLCRGHIGDFSGIPKAIRKKYMQLGIIPDFIIRNF